MYEREATQTTSEKTKIPEAPEIPEVPIHGVRPVLEA